MPRSRKRKAKEEIDPTAPPFQLCSSEPSFSEAFSSVAQVVANCKKIVVLAGAGISVSCGIPDFRSPNGLYATLETEELGLSCPEDLFDLDFFQHDPEPFYKFAKGLYFPLGTDKRVEPSDSHRFLALLEQQKKLLRVYTQNIDGLEEIAGVSPKRMVYAHGSLQWAACCRCKRKVAASEIESSIKLGQVPKCQTPLAELSTSQKTLVSPSRQLKRGRSSSDDSTILEPQYCNGVMKPGVTFFGETLKDKVRRCLEADQAKADGLIVIGTSLSVAPMSKVIQYLQPNIPRLLINRNIVQAPTVTASTDDDDDSEEQEFREGYTFDVHLLGFCDDVTRAMVKQIKGASENKGKLLASLPPDDEIFSHEDWHNNTKVPHDRVLLFPGAMTKGDDSSELTYTEVAICDGCEQEIEGTLKKPIRKCLQCFDYDLCLKCYPKLSKIHFEGKHSFGMEPSPKKIK